MYLLFQITTNGIATNNIDTNQNTKHVIDANQTSNKLQEQIILPEYNQQQEYTINNNNSKEMFTFENDNSITYGELKNGFKYAIKKCQNPKDQVFMTLNVDVGSAMENEHEQGIAHFLEHVAFLGSKNFPEGIDKATKEIGIKSNASTSFFETQFDIVIPNIHTDNILNVAMMSMQDFAHGLTIAENRVNSERGVILSEERDRSNINYRNFVHEIKTLFHDCSLPYRLPIGKKNIIEKVTNKDLRNFYEKWYTPDRMMLVVVGDIDPILIENQIKSRFTDIPTTNSHQYNREIHKCTGKTTVTFTPEYISPMLDFSVIIPNKEYKSEFELYRNLFKLNILQLILSQRISHENTNNPEITLTDISAYYQYLVFGLNNNYLELSLAFQKENWKQNLYFGHLELLNLLKYGPTTDEINFQKTSIKNTLEAKIKAENTIHSASELDRILTCYTQHRTNLSPVDTLKLFNLMADSFTKDDFIFNLNDLDFVYTISTDTENKNNHEHIAKEIEDTLKNLPILQLKDNNTISKFPYESNGDATITSRNERIIKSKNNKEEKIVQLTLSNNVKINLKQNYIRKNMVLISANFGYGKSSQEFTSNPGLKEKFESSIIIGGLNKLNFSEFSQLMLQNDINTSYSLNSFNSTLTEIVNDAKKNTKLALEALVAILSDSKFDSNVEKRINLNLENYSKNIQKSTKLTFMHEIHPWITSLECNKFSKLEHILSLSMSDVKLLSNTILKESPLEVSIVGDFEMEDMINIILTTLGGLQTRETYDSLQQSPLIFPKDAPEKITYVNSGATKTSLMIFFETLGKDAIETNLNLNIIKKCLYERIYEQIRSEDGNAYSPYLLLETSEFYNYGYLEIVISVDDKLVEDIKSRILNICSDIAEKGITSEEFAREKQNIINSWENSLETNNFWLTTLQLSQRLDDNFNFISRTQNYLQEITIDDVNATAKRFLHNPVFAQMKEN